MSEEGKLRRFEYHDGGSNKFWEIRKTNTDLYGWVVRWGRIGTEGQTKVKMDWNSTSSRDIAYAKLVSSKLGKGYKEVSVKVEDVPLIIKAQEKPIKAQEKPLLASKCQLKDKDKLVVKPGTYIEVEIGAIYFKEDPKNGENTKRWYIRLNNIDKVIDELAAICQPSVYKCYYSGLNIYKLTTGSISMGYDDPAHSRNLILSAEEWQKFVNWARHIEETPVSSTSLKDSELEEEYLDSRFDIVG